MRRSTFVFLGVAAAAGSRSMIQIGVGKSSWTSCFSIMAAILSDD